MNKLYLRVNFNGAIRLFVVIDVRYFYKLEGDIDQIEDIMREAFIFLVAIILMLVFYLEKFVFL